MLIYTTISSLITLLDEPLNEASALFTRFFAGVRRGRLKIPTIDYLPLSVVREISTRAIKHRRIREKQFHKSSGLSRKQASVFILEE